MVWLSVLLSFLSGAIVSSQCVRTGGDPHIHHSQHIVVRFCRIARWPVSKCRHPCSNRPQLVTSRSHFHTHTPSDSLPPSRNRFAADPSVCVFVPATSSDHLGANSPIAVNRHAQNELQTVGEMKLANVNVWQLACQHPE